MTPLKTPCASFMNEMANLAERLGADTNDMREAPSRTLMEALWQSGAIV